MPAPIAPPADSTGAYFVSITEMARRLGLGRSTGYELVANGTIRTVSYGKRRLVPVYEVERYAAELFTDQLGGRLDDHDPEPSE